MPKGWRGQGAAGVGGHGGSQGSGGVTTRAAETRESRRVRNSRGLDPGEADGRGSAKHFLPGSSSPSSGGGTVGGGVSPDRSRQDPRHPRSPCPPIPGRTEGEGHRVPCAARPVDASGAFGKRVAGRGGVPLGSRFSLPAGVSLLGSPATLGAIGPKLGTAGMTLGVTRSNWEQAGRIWDRAGSDWNHTGRNWDHDGSNWA